MANAYPVWSPDGKWIAYGSTRPGSSGIFRKLADGSGAEETLISTPDPTGFIPTDLSRDGKTLFYSTGLSIGDQIIWALPLDGERKPHQVVSRGTNGALSPNGRWLAYTAFAGGSEVYVVGYGGSQGKWQVSPNGGQVPHWSKDGEELYYFDGMQSISAVRVKDLGNTLEFGASQTLVSQWTILNLPVYSVTPDGKKLLMERVFAARQPAGNGRYQLYRRIEKIADFDCVWMTGDPSIIRVREGLPTTCPESVRSLQRASSRL